MTDEIFLDNVNKQVVKNTFKSMLYINGHYTESTKTHEVI